MPARAAALDHSPRLAAAALPLSQSSAMQATHAAASHPSAPKAAVNAPHTAATAAFAPLKNIAYFPYAPLSFYAQRLLYSPAAVRLRASHSVP